MATTIRGSSITEPEPQGPKWETTENPQRYLQTLFAYTHKMPARHILGVVGGNEASIIAGNQVDLESDLRRLNIPNTFCPERAYLPPNDAQTKIERKNVKTTQTIDIKKNHLPTYQMWGYPVTLGPLPLITESCGQPERF